MTATSLARSEREALCDLFLEVGPQAPTLCEGWTTLDLVAHLVVRERRLDSGPGLLVPALAGWTERVRTHAKGRGYERLVGQVRSGPPAWSPFRLVDELVNGLEMFVHHEDVRRGTEGWHPRELPDDITEKLWSRLASTARMGLRRSPVGVMLRRPDGTSIVARPGEPRVTVEGPVPELVLFTTGRRSAALVDLHGDPDDLESLRSAQIGL